MACFHPLTAYRLDDGSIVFNERGAVHSQLQLPCGQCIGCRIERSRQWAVRIIHESKLHKHNWFVTLTYDDDHLPTDLSLHYRDFQLFMKRLRKVFYGTKLRFYMCGEYGEDFSRPHFHACIFNLELRDLLYWKKSGAGDDLYRSPIIEKCWPNGFSSVGELNYKTAAYTSRYILKKVTGFQSDDHYQTINYATGEIAYRTPEFNKMSLKPGIGLGFYEKFHSDIYPNGTCCINGRLAKSPRYYDGKYKSDFPDDYESLEWKRYLTAMDHIHDNSDDRLKVREAVQAARLKFKQRTL